MPKGIRGSSQGECAVTGCEGRATTRGLCSKHYKFSRVHGFLVDDRVSRSLPEAIWSHFEKQPNGCWQWTGRATSAGYGCYGKPTQLAHRLMYELVIGPIPLGHHIDHQCHNRDRSCVPTDCLHRLCVNPSHLEAVLPIVNLQRGLSGRKIACKHGHLYDEANTYFTKAGHRMCRTCARLRMRRKFGWKGGWKGGA